MSTNIQYTNENYQVVTERQLNMLSSYFKHTYENDKLKKMEIFSFNKISRQLAQTGGTYYLSANEDLQNIIDQSLSNGKDWLFYYNETTNPSNDNLWDYEIYSNGVIREKGKKCFDSSARPIAVCSSKPEAEVYSGKAKFFYGDSLLFPKPFDGAAAFSFWYDQDNNPTEVYCEYGMETDNDYSIDEFIAQDSIMAIFPWEQYIYYHNFEPMLP